MKITIPIKKIEIHSQAEHYKYSFLRRIFSMILGNYIPAYKYQFKLTFETKHPLTINSIIVFGVRGITFLVISSTEFTATIVANQVMTSYSTGLILYSDKCTIVYQPINDCFTKNYTRLKY